MIKNILVRKKGDFFGKMAKRGHEMEPFAVQAAVDWVKSKYPNSVVEAKLFCVVLSGLSRTTHASPDAVIFVDGVAMFLVEAKAPSALRYMLYLNDDYDTSARRSGCVQRPIYDWHYIFVDRIGGLFCRNAAT